MRKINIDETNLQIDSIDLYKTEIIKISWSSKIGFGEYTISIKDDKIECSSETMDCNDDKDFLRKLLSLIVEKAEIVE